MSSDAYRLAAEAETVAGDGRRDVQPAVRALLSRLAVGLRAEADAREAAERERERMRGLFSDAAVQRDVALAAAGQAKEALAALVVAASDAAWDVIAAFPQGCHAEAEALETALTDARAVLVVGDQKETT